MPLHTRASVLSVILFLSGIAFPLLPVQAKSDSTLTVQAVPRPSGSVPLGAQRVTMLTVRLSASCASDIHLASLTFHHRGLGDYHDMQRVYGKIGTTRTTRAAPMTGSDPVATLRFRGVVIPACTTTSIDILADFSPSAATAGEHALVLESPADVVTDPMVKISLNPAESITITRPVGTPGGTVSVESLNLLGTLSYGSTRTVARLRLRADTKDDQLVSAITFTNDGTARNDDLQNFVLQTSGHTRLSPTIPALENDQVRVTLEPPLLLHRNEVRLVELLADIRASRRKTVRFIIQEESDVEAGPAR